MNKEQLAATQRQARSMECARANNLDFRFYGTSNTKRKTLYREFGYPEVLGFDDFYRAYKRNAVARAAVRRVIDNCWQDNPEIFEGGGRKRTARKRTARGISALINYLKSCGNKLKARIVETS
ncbi:MULTISPECIES: hypothetical protein [Escherichia]|uniref:hypothetical protein n=1 Tax=Escherichia TaxID=561 RepID=UPI001F375318|nr:MULTISPECIES: hypothetical protein [Escherichia]